jgi:hypothetical protein
MSNNFNILFKGNKSVNITSSVRDNNGNIYVVGYADGGTTQAQTSYIEIGSSRFTRNTYNTCGFVVKIYNNNVIWFKWIDGTLGQYVYSILIDKNNSNIYLVGLANSNIYIDNVEYKNATLTRSGFIVKILIEGSLEGSLVWLKWIDGTRVDAVYTCAIDSKNNIIIGGVSNSNTITSLNNTSPTRISPNVSPTTNITNSTTGTSSATIVQAGGFVLKMDKNGNYIWFKWIEGNKLDVVNSIVIDSLDNIYVAGNTLSGAINIDNNIFTRQNENKTIFLTKFKPNGINEWFNWVSGNINDSVPYLLCDKYDYVYLSGNSQSPNIIIDSIGYPRKNNNTSISLPFIVKFMNNTVSWFKWIEGTEHIFITSLQIDKQNSLYITGYTLTPTIEINDIKINNESKNSNGYLIKMKYNGDLEWGTWIYNFDKFDNKVVEINIVNTIIDNDYNIYFDIVSESNFIYFNDEKISSTDSSINKYGLLFKYNIKDIIYEKPKLYVYIKNAIIYMILFFILLIIIIIYVLMKLYMK